MSGANNGSETRTFNRAEVLRALKMARGLGGGGKRKGRQTRRKSRAARKTRGRRRD